MKVWTLPVFAAAFLVSVNAFAQSDEVSEQVLKRFLQYDLDENGSVSSQEYLQVIRERALKRFEDMDSNGDQEVTPDEFEVFWQARKAEYYRIRGK
jgi:Ca2+-binding EF-hand superfamily protein